MSLAGLCTREFLPFRFWGKGFKVLECVTIQGYVGGPDDAAEVDQGLFIYLILGEQFHVIAEVAQEPVELPEGAFGALEPAGEALSGERLWFEHGESEQQEGLLRVPAVGGPFDAHEEGAFQGMITIGLPGMKAWDMAFHWFTSEGRE